MNYQHLINDNRSEDRNRSDYQKAVNKQAREKTRNQKKTIKRMKGRKA